MIEGVLGLVLGAGVTWAVRRKPKPKAAPLPLHIRLANFGREREILKVRADSVIKGGNAWVEIQRELSVLEEAQESALEEDDERQA